MRAKIYLEKGETLGDAEDQLEKALNVKKECSHGEQYCDPALNEFHDLIESKHKKMLKNVIGEIRGVVLKDISTHLNKAFQNPSDLNKALSLVGGMRPGHKYIRREGTPGNYIYIYEDEQGREIHGHNAPVDHPHHDPGAPMVGVRHLPPIHEDLASTRQKALEGVIVSRLNQTTEEQKTWNALKNDPEFEYAINNDGTLRLYKKGSDPDFQPEHMMDPDHMRREIEARHQENMAQQRKEQMKEQGKDLAREGERIAKPEEDRSMRDMEAEVERLKGENRAIRERQAAKDGKRREKEAAQKLKEIEKDKKRAESPHESTLRGIKETDKKHTEADKEFYTKISKMDNSLESLEKQVEMVKEHRKTIMGREEALRKEIQTNSRVQTKLQDIEEASGKTETLTRMRKEISEVLDKSRENLVNERRRMDKASEVRSELTLDRDAARKKDIKARAAEGLDKHKGSIGHHVVTQLLDKEQFDPDYMGQDKLLEMVENFNRVTKNMFGKDMKKEDWPYDFSDAGLDVKISRLSFDSDGKGLQMQLKAYDKDGNDITSQRLGSEFTWNRKWNMTSDGKPHIYNSTLGVAPKFRKYNLGQLVNISQRKMLKGTGGSVTGYWVSSGSYTWANNGFSFKSASTLRSYRQNFQRALADEGIHLSDAEMELFTEPAHFAAFSTGKDYKLSNGSTGHFGKKFMANKSWDGKWQDGPDPSIASNYADLYLKAKKDPTAKAEAISILGKRYEELMADTMNGEKGTPIQSQSTSTGNLRVHSTSDFAASPRRQTGRIQPISGAEAQRHAEAHGVSGLDISRVHRHINGWSISSNGRVTINENRARGMRHWSDGQIQYFFRNYRTTMQGRRTIVGAVANYRLRQNNS